MAEKEKAVHKCVLCNSLLESKESLQEHFRKHANKEIDSKGTPSKLRMQKKVIKKEVTGIKKGKMSVVACDVCGQEFTNNTLAIQHKFKKHPEVSVKYICPYCGMQFTIKALFENHFKTHSSDTRKKSSILCKECGAEFYFETAKDYHYKSTHERLYILVDISTTLPAAVIVSTEKENLKNKTRLANRSMAGMNEKVEGSRKEKEYKVLFFSPDDDSSRQSCGNVDQVKTLFQPVPTPPPSKKIKMNIAGEIQSVFYCHLCGSEYVVKFNLQRHLEKTHSEEERCTVPNDLIRCTVCDALFYNQKAYETHNISHKSDDLYVTSEQQRLQTVSRVDQDFDIRRVLPYANKYLPSYKHKPKISSETDSKIKDEPKEELSPPSSPDSTDSEVDNDESSVTLKENSDTKGTKDPETTESSPVKN